MKTKVAEPFEVLSSLLGKHQAETAFRVTHIGLEGIARGLEQVDVVAIHVVNEVHITELDILCSEAQRVATVFLSLEVDGHLAHALAVHQGIVLVVLRNVDLCAVRFELELGQLATFVEANDCTINDMLSIAQVDGNPGALGFRS